MSRTLLSLSGQADPEEYIPVGWSSSQLNSICDIFGGGRLGLTKERHYQSSGVVAYSAAGPDGFVEKPEIAGADGVILSAIGAKCGRCFFATGSWTTLANVQAIIPGKGLDAKFLFYYVNRDGYWERSGSAQPFIKPSSIKSSWIVYPSPKHEQTKIAEILSTVDRAIEQTEALIAKQQRIKTGLMQDLLTRGIDEHGNLRSEQTHQFKDSPLGKIPVEWGITSLGRILSQNGGHIQTGPFGSQLHSHEYVGDGVPVVMPQDINGGLISTTKIAHITESRAQSLHRHRMRKGDLVFARRGDLSRCAVINPTEEGWLCGTGCLLMRPPTNALSPRWTAETYKFFTTQLQVEISSVGSTMPNLNTGILSSLQLALPSLSEQERIEDHLNAIEKEETHMTSALRKLRALKTALMQDLLTGRKRVTSLIETN